MTKEEILQEFSDINHVYNNCTRYDTLKRMLDELTASKTGHWEEAIAEEVKNLSKRVETLENQIKEEKEEQLKKLKAEIDYAKFRLESEPVDFASCAAEIFENQDKNYFLKKRG